MANKKQKTTSKKTSNNVKKSANNAKKAVKTAKKHPALVISVVVLLVVIIAAIVLLYYFKPDVFTNLFGNNTEIGTNGGDLNGGNGNGGNGGSGGGTGNGGGSEAEAGTVGEISSADLSIHFLELGNKSTGDCILIKCGDTEVLIDAGSVQGSAPTLKNYIDKYCEDGTLEYVISTHADTDHIAAFVGNSSGATRTGIFYQYDIDTLIKFDKTDKTTTIYQNYCAGLEYLQNKTENPTTVYTASQCYEEKDGAQRQYYLDEEHTVSINILYNYYYYNSSPDENNYSVVMLLTQELDAGNKYFLFTGDLEEDGESKLVDYYSNVPAEYNTAYNILPEYVDLYKAGHHGSKTSSTEKLMSAVKPRNVVVCCCCGTTEYTVNNRNTFPTQEMINNVGVYTDKIYVTSLATGLSEYDPVTDTFASKSFGGYESMNGNIVFYTVDGVLKLYCSANDTILKDTDWFKTYRTWNGV